MLSLKELKAQQDAIKAQLDLVSKTASPQGPAQSNIKGLIKPFLFTSIISNLHRIPGVPRLIKLLSLWYGRTTWWKILVMLRKAFVLMNALIGMFAIIKISGFSMDNIAVGISTMGYNYVEGISTITRKVFDWLYSFFNNRTPDVPKNPGSWISDPREWSVTRRIGWETRPMTSDGIAQRMLEVGKNQNFFNPQPQTRGWLGWIYDGIPSWLWYTGVAVISIGTLYLGYKVIIDPSWITPFAQGGPGNPGLPEIQVNDVRTETVAATIAKQFTRFYRGVAHYTNPFTYLPTANQSNDAFQAFMKNQTSWENRNYKLYPFTEINPHASWLNQWKLALFGESSADALHRLSVRNLIDSEYNALRVQDGLTHGLASGSRTPGPWSTGIGLNSHLPEGSASAVFSHQLLVDKLAPLALADGGALENWSEHVKAAVHPDWMDYNTKNLEKLLGREIVNIDDQRQATRLLRAFNDALVNPSTSITVDTGPLASTSLTASKSPILQQAAAKFEGPSSSSVIPQVTVPAAPAIAAGTVTPTSSGTVTVTNTTPVVPHKVLDPAAAATAMGAAAALRDTLASPAPAPVTEGVPGEEVKYKTLLPSYEEMEGEEIIQEVIRAYLDKVPQFINEGMVELVDTIREVGPMKEVTGEELVNNFTHAHNVFINYLTKIAQATDETSAIAAGKLYYTEVYPTIDPLVGEAAELTHTYKYEGLAAYHKTLDEMYEIAMDVRDAMRNAFSPIKNEKFWEFFSLQNPPAGIN